MGMIRSERFLPSGTKLRLPLYAAEHLVMSGLTAPQWRLALALLCSVKDSGSVTLEKPMLEQLSGVTLNTVEALIAPLLDAEIDLPGDELHGHHVFESIEYQAGAKGKSVGQIRATSSVAMGQFLARGRNRTVVLPADEMRRYACVSSIILRMRLGAALERETHSALAGIRITAADVFDLFGGYGRVAVIQRPSKLTGEVVQHVSLSRAGTVLVMPAVNEIAAVSKAMKPMADVQMDGRKWSSIEITAKRLTVRDLSPEPNAPRVTAVRPILRGRPTRAVVKPVKV